MDVHCLSYVVGLCQTANEECSAEWNPVTKSRTFLGVGGSVKSATCLFKVRLQFGDLGTLGLIRALSTASRQESATVCPTVYCSGLLRKGIVIWKHVDVHFIILLSSKLSPASTITATTFAVHLAAANLPHLWQVQLISASKPREPQPYGNHLRKCLPQHAATWKPLRPRRWWI